jgi:hypothetical protein
MLPQCNDLKIKDQKPGMIRRCPQHPALEFMTRRRETISTEHSRKSHSMEKNKPIKPEAENSNSKGKISPVMIRKQI